MTIFSIIIVTYLIAFFLLPPLMRWMLDRYMPKEIEGPKDSHLRSFSWIPGLNITMLISVILISTIAEIGFFYFRLRGYDKNDEQ